MNLKTVLNFNNLFVKTFVTYLSNIYLKYSKKNLEY